ncbi:MAG: cadherin-like domain-containing protein [Nitrososphaera sp.]|nr:cadherin-like domain-containing protein [Nitrososphaera sp.]
MILVGRWFVFVNMCMLFARSHAAIISYRYDTLNRITNVAYAGGAFEKYSYDSAGNRVRSESHNPLSISGVVDKITDAGFATPAIPVSVGSDTLLASALTLAGRSASPMLVPKANILTTGSEANRIVTITPSLNQYGATLITLLVNDGSVAAKTDFLLSVGHAPQAFSDDLERPRDAAVKVDELKLIDNDFDMENDLLTITAVESPLASGATVIHEEGVVYYSPPPGFNEPDSFTYTVSDGFGGTSTATVSVSVRPPDTGPAKNLLSLEFVGVPLHIHLRFSTLPGKIYQVQMSTNLIDWFVIGSATAGLNGMLTFDDNDPTITEASIRFYRLHLP